MFTYFPFDSGAGGSVTEAEWRQMARLWLSGGVIRGELDGGAVSQHAAGANKSVDVASLQAWVDGHFFQSDAVENLTIADNASGNPRIDRIVIHADFTANTIALQVVQGTAAATPTPPALTQSSSAWEIPLAQVAVANGFTSIADANITDDREYAAGIQDWQHVPGTLTYSSADGHTFVATASADLTGIVPLGARFRCVQAAGVFYGIVTAVASGSITLYGGTDYTLADAAISSSEFSIAKAPVGFNADPAKWTETLKDTNDRTQATPTTGSWYNIGSLSIAIPIGVWDVSWAAGLSSASAEMQASLSYANNSESDSDFTAGLSAGQTFVGRRKCIAVTAKMTYYLIERNETNTQTIGVLGSSLGPTIVSAICAYL